MHGSERAETRKYRVDNTRLRSGGSPVDWPDSSPGPGEPDCTMSNLMLNKKKKKESPTNRSGTLGPDMSFLFVIQDACRRGERYTLTAESKGLKYAVRVARNGPFNVTGGGYTGSAALAMAAALRTGTYSMSEGWPELQPYYQLGLDTTLKTLLDGHARSDVEELPPPRGVDWIRNAEGDSTPTYTPSPRDIQPVPQDPAGWTRPFRRRRAASAARGRLDSQC